MDVFGKSGQGLLPLLSSGAAGLGAMQAEAAALGLSFSRLDAAKVEEANDAISRVKAVFVGLARSAVISLAPSLQSAAEGFKSFAVTARANIQQILPTLQAFSAAARDTFARIYQTLRLKDQTFMAAVARLLNGTADDTNGTPNACPSVVAS